MSQKNRSSAAGSVCLNLATLFISGLLLSGISAAGQAVSGAPNQGHGYAGTVPYKGSVQDALAAAAAGSTIPLTTGTFVGTKDNSAHTVTFVGASPLAATKTATYINFLIVPVIVDIGSTTFDPTSADTCITNSLSPLAAFQQSPLLQQVAFDGGSGAGHASLINGVNIGRVPYPDAFRRAEFWGKVAGSNYHTILKVSATTPWTIKASDVQNMGGGKVWPTGCAVLGVLPTSGFQSYISGTVIPSIPEITPTTFVFFLLKDVVTTSSSTLDCSSFCEIGYHSVQGSPQQFYAVGEYDTTKSYWSSPGIEDISIITHEIGEWMDDPLVTNWTPTFGNIGQISGCQSVWEPGDPLTGVDFPAITMANGVTYHAQELAFWSWFYDAQGTHSVGAGGKFSMNGTFQGPSQPCPPGGTY
jgi:hypothetical protein